MSAAIEPLSCPFCGASVGLRVRVCPHCRAERRSAPGMTPRQFRWFALLWASLALPLMVLAVYLAVLPWTRTGAPPGYALSLVGASEAAPQARCRVVVFEPNGQRSEQVSDGPCGSAGAAGTPGRAAAASSDPPAPSARRLASVLHSTIALAGGALACWLLLAPLRRLFRRRAAFTWVRRLAQGHP
ncbi:hypothetical protein [Ramlibacter sp.]|uniref:hypothetical protein n=1 Tax=Ramlibacter sp. TaxID=1917967 RepID=UPI002D60AFA1|nr:hypothetical protein [Ramlibacter sp.]HYD76029.1 hypothetical protein [Ramlibacter sp.]